MAFIIFFFCFRVSFYHDNWYTLLGFFFFSGGFGYYVLSWGKRHFYHSYLHASDFLDKAIFPFNKLSPDRNHGSCIYFLPLGFHPLFGCCVAHLLCKHKALSSIPRTHKKNTNVAAHTRDPSGRRWRLVNMGVCWPAS